MSQGGKMKGEESGVRALLEEPERAWREWRAKTERDKARGSKEQADLGVSEKEREQEGKNKRMKRERDREKEREKGEGKRDRDGLGGGGGGINARTGPRTQTPYRQPAYFVIRQV